MKSLFRIFGALMLFLCSTASASERFENRYLKFILPDGWKCGQEETEFVCNPPWPKGKPHPAIMIFTAKLVGPQDNLAAYMEHLAQLPSTKADCTMVSPPATRKINGIIWVDATLRGSEIRNFDTRYVGTVTHGIAVLFTFSVHKNFVAQYAGAFTLATQTLMVKPEAGGKPE